MLSITHGAMGNRSATNTIAVLWGVDHNGDCGTPGTRWPQKHKHGCNVKAWSDIDIGDVLHCFP